MGLLRDVALGVEEAVEPLFDDDGAAEVVGMGADGTPTKRIDEVAEKAALDLIEEHGDVRVVSEERGEVVYGEPEATVVLDPLDGTYNASNGVPFYSVSVALVDGDSVNDTVESHVRELTTGVSYTATRGDGAFCDGEPIEVEGDTTPSKMTLGGVYNIEGFDPARFKRVRLLGCSSLELCYTAAGRFDAFADLRSRLRVVDFAAAKLVVEEAGGKVTDAYGDTLENVVTPQQRSSVVAAEPDVHDEVLKVVKPGSDGDGEGSVENEPGGGSEDGTDPGVSEERRRSGGKR